MHDENNLNDCYIMPFQTGLRREHNEIVHCLLETLQLLPFMAISS